MPNVSFSNCPLFACVCLWLLGVLLVHNGLLSFIHFDSMRQSLTLVRKLSLITFMVMIELYVLIPVFLLLFALIESFVECSLFLALLIFSFFWFTELIMPYTFLTLMGSSIPLLSFILS
jgi:hypothetical protein